MAVTRQCFEVFRFPVMQSTFCFCNIAIITIPAASLTNYFRPKGAVESVFIGGKKDLLTLLTYVTSEDVCWSIRNVKYINESFHNMRCSVMFITAVCLIFLLKLKWPRNKSFYDLVNFCFFVFFQISVLTIT